MNFAGNLGCLHVVVREEEFSDEMVPEAKAGLSKYKMIKNILND